MKKKGFTLVELLAVIVILTIIILITVPKINDIIQSSRMEAFRNNVLNLFEAVKKLEANSSYKLDEEGINYNDKRLKITNNPFTGGKIKLNEAGEAFSDKITDDTFCALGTKKKLEVFEGDCDLAASLSNVTFIQTPSKQAWYRGKQITIGITNFEKYPYTFEFSVDGGEKFHKITKKNTNLIFGNYNGQAAKDFYKTNYGQTFNNNLDTGNIIVRVSYKNNFAVASYKITMVDSTAPTNATLKLVKRSTNAMYVMASAKEEESYIKTYEFKIDDGSYINNGTEPSYKFKNVTQGTHTVTVRITNAVGDSVTVTQTFKPATLVAPEISISPRGTSWVKKRTITITYPMNRTKTTESEQNNYVYKYKVYGINASASSVDYVTVPESLCKIETDSLDNRHCVITKDVTASSNIIATVSAGTNQMSQTAKAENIDAIAPTISNISHYVTDTEVRLHVTASDTGGSGLVSPYECSKDAGTTWTSSEGTVCKFSSLTKNTKYSFKIRTKDNAGNITTADRIVTTAATTPALTMVEQKDGNYKNVKITFPNMGDAATYEYQVGSSGTWVKTTSLTVTTSQIKTNNTAVTARIYYNGKYVLSKTVNVVIDITAPVCTWSGPSGTTKNGYIKNGQTLTYTLTCTDDYKKFSDATIVSGNITSSNSNVATASVGTRTTVNDGYKWTITVTGKGTTGNAKFTLAAGSVADAVGNKNVAKTSAETKVDNTAPTLSVNNNSGNNWKSSVVISGVYSDDHSGVDKETIQYTYDKSTVLTDWDSKNTTSYSGTWTASRNQQVWIRVADNLGNYTAWKDAGWVKIESFSISGSSWSETWQIGGYWYSMKFQYDISHSSGLSTGNCYMYYAGCSAIYYGSSGPSCGNASWGSYTWYFGRTYGPVYAHACTNAGKCGETSA